MSLSDEMELNEQPAIVDQAYLRTMQYKTDDKLRARIQLHRLFGTNPYPWQRWVFDQLELQPGWQVLEIGCGPADLWCENLERVPPGLQLVLGDLSPGMLLAARDGLAKQPSTEPPAFVRYCAVDAQALPFPTDTFDLVIANHMLYHVPDLPRGLGEIRRVLKPGGGLCAATNGLGHMRELVDLIEKVQPGYLGIQRQLQRYCLENAPEKLAQVFSSVKIIPYLDDLVVTAAEPLLAYIDSMWEVNFSSNPSALNYFEQIIRSRLAQDGKMIIHKSQGLVLGRQDKS